ncbi:MAG: hypothetical protein Q9226_007223, partial [Calogaya cf. arnoldii]
MSFPDHQAKNSPSRDFIPTSDAESSFFRSWALRPRKLEYSSSSDVSPGTRTPEGPISPMTLAPRPRPPTRSFLSFPASHVQYGESDQYLQPMASPQTPPGAATHERRSSRSRGSVDTRASTTNSNASSIARRALGFLKDPTSSRKPSAAQHPRPGGPAKNSVAWKREMSGHWLEIRIGKKEPVETPPETQHSTSHIHYSPDLSSHTATRRRKASGHSKPKVSLAPPPQDSTDSSSPDGKPKETLVNRTKRILGIKSAFSLSTEQPTRGRQRSTIETLDRTSAALQNLVELTPSSDSSTSNMSTTSIGVKSKSKQRNLVRPRYHRQHTGHSSSSSVMRVMLGNPPVSTPNDESMYTGSDSQQYFRVELTAPHAPAYLPSEARRIGTPPPRVRGFFFDYNAPPLSPPKPLSGPWPTEPMNISSLQPRHSDKAFRLPHTPSGRSPGVGARPYTPSGRRTPGGQHLDLNGHGGDWFRVKVPLGYADEER